MEKYFTPSSNYFYQSHKKEIEKYVNQNSNFINLVNINSRIPQDSFDNLVYIDPQKEILDYFNNQDMKYDTIVLTDIFELSSDIYNLLKKLIPLLSDDGKLILSSINPNWFFLVKIVESLRLKPQSNLKSYIRPNKIERILEAVNLRKIKSYNRLPVPLKLFGLGILINYFFNLVFPFLNFGIRNYLVYSKSSNNFKSNIFSKSILIPAKNEEGNLQELIERIPSFDAPYELIIICGESKDKTYEKSLQIQKEFKNLDIKVMKQTKNGKANAIWEGLSNCQHDLIAILDSDLSVDPETLTEFFEIIEYGNADFVNGTRLIYKMEDDAMRKLNKIGNWAFQFLISKLIDVKLSDSLCGTKVFRKKDIESIYKWQSNMYVKDPFCDFDLIFSAAYSSSKIVELPVHYRSRTYGATNISRFRDGWKLLFYFLNSYFLFKTDFSRTSK